MDPTIICPFILLRKEYSEGLLCQRKCPNGRNALGIIILLLYVDHNVNKIDC